jgi:deazaflavin-dependent oxidoreductase (nitroreductase family)
LTNPNQDARMTYFTPEETKTRDEAYRTRTKDHVARYLATDGEDGYDDNSLKAPTLLLTTTGRRSGNTYVTPLNFAEHEGTYLLIASYGGSDAHPKWYLNLVANPEVGVQVKGHRFQAIARTAHAAEKERLWPVMATRMPFYDEYREATHRDIPLIVLEPRQV